MIFPHDGVHGLTLEGVISPGKPNEEHIVIRCREDTNTGNVGLMIAFNEPGLGYSTPVRDRLFWFGLGFMKSGATIRLFTGTGDNVSFDSGNGFMNHHFFWGLDYTQFHDQRLMPTLFRVSGAIVGRSIEPPPAPKPALQVRPNSSSPHGLRALGDAKPL